MRSQAVRLTPQSRRYGLRLDQANSKETQSVSISPDDEVRVSVPGICDRAQADLAHEFSSPRERAHRNGVGFPYRSAIYDMHKHSDVPVETFQQVLDGLKALANGTFPNDSRDG